jgi:hypothetical protein
MYYVLCIMYYVLCIIGDRLSKSMEWGAGNREQGADEIRVNQW